MNSRHTPFQLQNNHQGYTIIELVIVIGISAILLITAVALFFTTFIGGGKTASGEYTKQAGGQALSQMTFLIRNARRIVQNPSGTVCGSPMDSLTVLGLDGGVTTFSRVVTGAGANAVTQIASSSGATTAFLTPTEVSVSNFTISCAPVAYGQTGWDGSPPIVNISFTLSKGAGGQGRDLVTIPFSTSITLRNF